MDDYYHLAFLDPKTRKVVGKEHQFRTLEELLGCLHSFEEDQTREGMFICLMGMRDGQSEVEIRRKQFNVDKQILRIRPSNKFAGLFWKGADI
jgi:hypothetical protein